MKIQLVHDYQYIISLKNFLAAWKEFLGGKRSRKDVQEFELNLMSNIITLHQDLAVKTYRHAPYTAFNVSDPKPRNIHKAGVRDRLLHRALYRTLYPFFERTFIADSYSCRSGKGTHKAMKRFRTFAYQASKNHTKTVWVLKGDIRKFFANIDQNVLTKIITSYIPDKDVLWLIFQIVQSFHSTKKGVGLPLGNITSQLLVNVYMNKFDQFVKHTLKGQYYIRYADDFVILSEDRKWLFDTLPKIKNFLWNELHLQLHPDKVSLRTIASGVDFLGLVHFPNHRVLRTATKRKMLRCIRARNGKIETVRSYLGLLSHGNTITLQRKIRALVDTEQCVMR